MSTNKQITYKPKHIRTPIIHMKLHSGIHIGTYTKTSHSQAQTLVHSQLHTVKRHTVDTLTKNHMEHTSKYWLSTNRGSDIYKYTRQPPYSCIMYTNICVHTHTNIFSLTHTPLHTAVHNQAHATHRFAHTNMQFLNRHTCNLIDASRNGHSSTVIPTSTVYAPCHTTLSHTIYPNTVTHKYTHM